MAQKQAESSASRPRGRSGGAGGGPSPRPALVGYAAMLCARDRESDAAIARRLGIGRRTLARWKKRPELAAALTAAGLTRWEARGKLDFGLWCEGLGPLPTGDPWLR